MGIWNFCSETMNSSKKSDTYNNASTHSRLHAQSPKLPISVSFVPSFNEPFIQPLLITGQSQALFNKLTVVRTLPVTHTIITPGSRLPSLMPSFNKHLTPFLRYLVLLHLICNTHNASKHLPALIPCHPYTSHPFESSQSLIQLVCTNILTSFSLVTPIRTLYNAF